MVSAKIIEIEKDANKNEYGILNNQFNDKPQINNRDFKILKSLLKFDSTSYDTMKEKRQILLQITFKNEIVIFLLHLNQVTLFDLRPNKFNFIRIFNGEKFKEFISNYLNKNK